MFIPDTAGKYDDNTDENNGFKERKAWIKQSSNNEFELCGPICSNFLRSDNHLAPGNKLSLKFIRAPDEFVFLSPTPDAGYKLKILELAIYARRIRLFPHALNAVFDPRAIQRYVSDYTEIKEYSLPSGLSNWNSKLFTGGYLPKQIVVGMVETRALVGSYARNPFNFQHFNVSSINLKVNGVCVPQEPLRPDFPNGRCMREYNHLFMNTGKYRINSGNCISLADFKGGSTLFPFDLTPDQCNMYNIHVGKEGTMSLEITWSTGLPQGITILVYAVYDQVVMINGMVSDQPTVSVF